MRTTVILHQSEDVALSVSLAGLVIIPLAEGVLRRSLHTGIAGAQSFVQHLTLIAGMLGAAIAVRENRMLSLSTLGTMLKGRIQHVASTFSAGCAAAVS